jgi:hypothetical protein
MKKLLKTSIYDLPMPTQFVKDESERSDISNTLHKFILGVVDGAKKRSAKIKVR